jgi:LysR family transcriptional regulator, chromosome initiation inhibitor
MIIEQRGLHALDAVIQTQSFEKAAQQLFVTQPAISQRIKQLENKFGQPLLVRTLPYKATPVGEKLLSLLRRARLLEEHFLQELGLELPGRLSVALNRDSLETWFMHVLHKLRVLEVTNIDIITDDQEVTIDYFRQGAVSACITSYAKALPGCECELLGYMDYLLLASPAFYERYFDNDLPLQENMTTAPIILFDSRDRMHHHYFKHFFNVTLTPERYHMVPSVQGFKEFALQGYGFGLIPRLDVESELADGKLVEINPGRRWLLPLYWHYWQLPARQYQHFIRQVADDSGEYLIQESKRP